ncbi:hypothetical protein V5O48_005479 [Marasmius crinis-equi]|uniref:Uncharacterized protein n=1 Tax=Marasmius crinis-equi TaxID=585013 RepID=A0ABR3FM61_9AGAR
MEGHALPAPHSASGPPPQAPTLPGSIPSAKERFPPPAALAGGTIVGRSPNLIIESQQRRDRDTRTPPSAVTPSRSPVISSAPNIHNLTRRPSSVSLPPANAPPSRAEMSQPLPPQPGQPLPVRGGVLDLLPPQHEQSHQRHQKMQMQVQTMQVARQDVGETGHAPGEVLPLVRKERVVLDRSSMGPERERSVAVERERPVAVERERERERERVREETPPQRHFQGQFHTQFVSGLNVQQQREMKERERERERESQMVREQQIVRERDVVREREREQRDREREMVLRERERERDMPFAPPNYHPHPAHMHPHFHGPPSHPSQPRLANEPPLHPHAHGHSHSLSHPSIPSAPAHMMSSSSSHDGRSHPGHAGHSTHGHHAHSHSHSHSHHGHPHHQAPHHHHVLHHHHRRDRSGDERDRGRDREREDRDRDIRAKRAISTSRDRDREREMRERDIPHIPRERERDRERGPPPVAMPIAGDIPVASLQRELRERDARDAREREIFMRERDIMRDREMRDYAQREREYMENEYRERDREAQLRERRDREMSIRDRDPREREMRDIREREMRDREFAYRERAAMAGQPPPPREVARDRDREREYANLAPHAGHASLPSREHVREREREREPPHGPLGPMPPRERERERERERDRERERERERERDRDHREREREQMPPHASMLSPPTRERERPPPPPPPPHGALPLGVVDEIPFGIAGMGMGMPMHMTMGGGVPGVGLGASYPDDGLAPGSGMHPHPGLGGMVNGVAGTIPEEEEVREVKSRVKIDLGVWVWPKTPFPWIFGESVGPPVGGSDAPHVEAVEEAATVNSNGEGSASKGQGPPAEKMDVDGEKEPGEVDETEPGERKEGSAEKMSIDDGEREKKEGDGKSGGPEAASVPSPIVEEKKSSPTLSKAPSAPKPSTSAVPEDVDDPNLLDTQTLTTIVIPSGYLPSAQEKGKMKMRIWGGGIAPSGSYAQSYLQRNEGPSSYPFRSDQPHLSSSDHPKQPTYRPKRPRRRRIYTDDSDPFLCALHSGWITWSSAHRAKDRGKDLKITLRVIRCIGGGGETRLTFEDSGSSGGRSVPNVALSGNSRPGKRKMSAKRDGESGADMNLSLGIGGLGGGGWGKEEVVARFIGGEGERFWCAKNLMMEQLGGSSAMDEKENKVVVDNGVKGDEMKKEDDGEGVKEEVEKPRKAVEEDLLELENQEDDDGRSIRSAGWGSGHDGSAIEVVDVEWVDKSVHRRSGVRNRSQRLLEYTLRRTALIPVPSHSSSPTNTYVNPRKRRRAENHYTYPYPTQLWRARKRNVMANAVPLDPILEMDDEEEGEFERCLVGDFSREQTGEVPTTPTILLQSGNGGVWYKYDPDALRIAFDSWPSSKEEDEGRGSKRRRLSPSGASASEKMDEEALMVLDSESSDASTIIRRTGDDGKFGVFSTKTKDSSLEKVREYSFPSSASMEVDEDKRKDEIAGNSDPTFDLAVVSAGDIDFMTEGVVIRAQGAGDRAVLGVRRWRWV